MADNWERFKVIRELGRGAFGSTLLVEDRTQHGALVVIKLPHNEEMEMVLINDVINGAVLRTSLTEMRNPNVVRYVGFDKYDGRYVMIMEYVKGRNLRQIIGPISRNREPLDVKLARKIVVQVCNGLAGAHEVKLIHRDIKPENILIRDEDGVAKLADFGISTIIQSSAAVGTVAGTFPYMAPEAFHGRTSFQSDVWSLAVTLYEMITGRLPFVGSEMFEVKDKIERQTLTPPSELNSAVDEGLNEIVIRGLQKDPQKRFATAGEMLAALRDQEDESILPQIAAAREMFSQGKTPQAQELLEDLLQRHPTSARLYMAVADLFCRRQQYGDGEHILRKGALACPEHAPLHFYLAMVLSNLQKREDAIAAMEKALAIGLDAVSENRARVLIKNWQGGRG